MFTRNSSAVPKLLGPHSTTPAGTENAITMPSTGEKSIIGNDLKIVGQGLKIISRGILQVDGEIEGDVMAAAARRRVKSSLRDQPMHVGADQRNICPVRRPHTLDSVGRAPPSPPR